MTFKFKSGDFCFQLEGGMQLPLAVLVLEGRERMVSVNSITLLHTGI